ncbi:MAG: tRNA 5-methoxyuridine(34)/uridine 5-oxyacetic acid(34) synthase CmoB, partial [Campylobacterota bacterium]
MDIDAIKKERQKWMGWKNIAPIRQALDALPACTSSVSLGDTIEITTDLDDAVIEKTAKMMIPWRKGPFAINSVFIDSEWQSFLKYNLLAPHFDVDGKSVADIGCNNGYYLFRMSGQGAKELVGFDPSALNLCQFDFLDRFIQSGIRYELLGVEHLPFYEQTFDLIFCLGVLYHRIDPIGTLKSLRRGLNKGGEMILDTFMIDGEQEVALTPRGRYSRMRNVFFIPTV